MAPTLLAGAAEVDITPPVGTALAGNLKPRTSTGIQDPLTFKAIVLEAGGVKLAYVLADLVAMTRQTGDALVAQAANRTGIPATNIVWAASHTHTGPYTWPVAGVANELWLAGLPEMFARAVELADKARRPARLCLERGYCNGMVHNRRLKYKDGRELNTWLLHGGEADVQCLGSAAPVDPEVGILSFDDEAGLPIAILWHYAVHAHGNFGSRFSADYPGVVAGRLRERFGVQTVPIFMPGACGDINWDIPDVSPDRQAHRILGDQLANIIMQRMDQRKPRLSEISLGVLKQEVVVPCRDFTVDQEVRIKASQWSPENAAFFRAELEAMRQAGVRNERTLIQAWRIGDIGFASVPGELFVEWGLKIKAESPFPWTFPVTLGGDRMGYLITQQAWLAGGYESLINRYSRVSVEGAAHLVDVAQQALVRLWERQ
ncbi:MAG: hypothetical protein WCL16_00180 [bacterium]